MPKVTLLNKLSFICDSNKSILDSAKNNNIILEYSCGNGRCRTCIAKLKSGVIENINEEKILSEDEKKEGYFLTCNTFPKTDILIDIMPVDEKFFIPKRIIPAKISELKYISKNLLKLTLRIPPATRLKYHNGQFINIIRNGTSRSYSIANSFKDTSSALEFYIRNYKSGKMSRYWFQEAKVDDLLRIEGPLGTFYIKGNEKSKNLLFLATGTGLSPIKAILEDNDQLISKHKNIFLYHGARVKEDLFWEPPAKIKYYPVLSRPDKSWHGECGYVQNLAIRQKLNFEDTTVFACGSLEMINDAKIKLINNGLNESNFFYDAFVKS